MIFIRNRKTKLLNQYSQIPILSEYNKRIDSLVPGKTITLVEIINCKSCGRYHFCDLVQITGNNIRLNSLPAQMHGVDMYSKLLSIFILCFTTFLSNFVTGQTCQKFLTINITDGVRENNGINKDGIYYDAKDYFKSGNDTLGCVCNIRKCARKCCEQDEFMMSNKCVKKLNNTTINFITYDYTTKISSSTNSDFFMVYGKDCPEKFSLFQAYEPVYLQNTGLLFYAEDDYSELYSIEKYCIDDIDGQISALLCEKATQQEKDLIIKGNGE